MSQDKHIYNFSADGTVSHYYKLWFWLFNDGLFARVHASAWRVYCRLVSMADFASGAVELSQAQIAQDCGLNRTSIPELIRELSALGLIMAQNRTNQTGKIANLYFVCRPPLSISRPSGKAVYAGQVISDQPVDISVTPSSNTPGHVRLAGELFSSGYFSSLARDHSTWKTYCSLLYRADFNNGYCWPSIDQIIADCGLSRATIVKALQNLQNSGLIRIVKYTTENDKIANGYYIWPYDIISEFDNGSSLKSRHKEFKKPTSRSLNIKQAEFKKPTSVYVGNLNSNINTTNTNTTNLSASRISENSSIDEISSFERQREVESILDFYYSDNPRRGGLARSAGLQYIQTWIDSYGADLVRYVIRQNREVYSANLMANYIENAAAIHEKKRSAQESRRSLQIQMSQEQIKPVSQAEPARVRSTEDFIEMYRGLLESGRGNSIIRERLTALETKLRKEQASRVHSTE